MRSLHYVEIENLKCFGERQRVELGHPAVLYGPNGCGQTTVLQAVSLWSQAVKTWQAVKGTAPPNKRTATPLNRLRIPAVPIRRSRHLWHNTAVRRGHQDIRIVISAGIVHDHQALPVTMQFRSYGEDLVYCIPSDATLEKPEWIEAAARLSVEILYPIAGLAAEEPILRRGRIDVLVGQGQTARVLRNLCLLVRQDDAGNWERVRRWIRRLFRVQLGNPEETLRGTVDLSYRQPGIKEPLDISLAGRGLQQLLLIFAYLHSHRCAVLLIDQPDAHLEILRQRQAYALLRDLASKHDCQVVLATHSEAILEEAVDRNLTVLADGRAEDLSAKGQAFSILKRYGVEHYVNAAQRGYVLYIESGPDLECLRALASHLGHRAADLWDDRINALYVRSHDKDPVADSDSDHTGVRRCVAPERHFGALRSVLPELAGLAILNPAGGRSARSAASGLPTVQWRNSECANCFVTPDVLVAYARDRYSEAPLYESVIRQIMDEMILERVFNGDSAALMAWNGLGPDARGAEWESRTGEMKLSDFAGEYFRRLASTLGHAILLRKGDLHRLVEFANPGCVSDEASEKLDLVADLFEGAAARRA